MGKGTKKTSKRKTTGFKCKSDGVELVSRPSYYLDEHITRYSFEIADMESEGSIAVFSWATNYNPITRAPLNINSIAAYDDKSCENINKTIAKLLSTRDVVDVIKEFNFWSSNLSVVFVYEYLCETKGTKERSKVAHIKWARYYPGGIKEFIIWLKSECERWVKFKIDREELTTFTPREISIQPPIEE